MRNGSGPRSSACFSIPPRERAHTAKSGPGDGEPAVEVRLHPDAPTGIAPGARAVEDRRAHPDGVIGGHHPAVLERTDRIELEALEARRQAASPFRGGTAKQQRHSVSCRLTHESRIGAPIGASSEEPRVAPPRHSYRRSGLPGRRFAALLVGILLLFLQPSALLAHTPTSHWTCYEGGGGSPGLCFFHLNNAFAYYHYQSEVPTGPRDAIHRGTHTIMDDHALQLTETASATNHVHWDTFCQVACMVEKSRNTAAQHITGFDVHFDPGAGPASGWNQNTSLGHGAFTTLDLWSVAGHEWGHAVGMGHSSSAFGHDCTSKTTVNNAWATMTQGQCLIGGHTEQRTINNDDFTGRCQIYDHSHGYACSGD
jgi:hypothetical protein